MLRQCDLILPNGTRVLITEIGMSVDVHGQGRRQGGEGSGVGRHPSLRAQVLPQLGKTDVTVGVPDPAAYPCGREGMRYGTATVTTSRAKLPRVGRSCRFAERSYDRQALGGRRSGVTQKNHAPRSSSCRLPPIPFVFNPKTAAVEISNVPFSLSLGDCRGRRPVGLRCHRRDVFVAGFTYANLAGYRLVGYRRVQRDDDRFPRDGVHEHALGYSVRPAGAAPGGADRIGRTGGEPRAGQPCVVAISVSIHLRRDGRRCGRRDLCADDGDRHRLVRYPSQPCGLAGFGRNGHGAHDHVAAGRMADLEP